eukprot:COSAG04_NODE_9269_length_880_cov_1.236876_1_plen_46_part_01
MSKRCYSEAQGADGDGGRAGGAPPGGAGGGRGGGGGGGGELEFQKQ